MSATTITDYTGLPDDVRNYTRTLIDPRYLQDGKTGDLYVRKDGQPWPHCGYKVQKTQAGTLEKIPATAPEDRDERPFKS